MDPEIALVERVIHLALFVSGGIAIAVAALAVLERVAGREPASDGGHTPRRTIRGVHVGAAAGLFALLFAFERVYHATL